MCQNLTTVHIDSSEKLPVTPPCRLQGLLEDGEKPGFQTGQFLLDGRDSGKQRRLPKDRQVEIVIPVQFLDPEKRIIQ